MTRVRFVSQHDRRLLPGLDTVGAHDSRATDFTDAKKSRPAEAAPVGQRVRRARTEIVRDRFDPKARTPWVSDDSRPPRSVKLITRGVRARPRRRKRPGKRYRARERY